MYLDDMLILGKTPGELNHNFSLTKSLLTSLFFFVNEEKPSQVRHRSWSFWIPHKLQENDTVSDRGKVESSYLTVQESVGCSADHNSTACSCHWPNDLNDSNNPPSSPPLPCASRAEKHSLEPWPLIQCPDYSDSGSEAESDLVESLGKTMEITKYSTSKTSANSGIRCLWSGLGSSEYQPTDLDGWSLEEAGDQSAHQLQRASCSLVWPTVLCSESERCTHIPQNRQYSSCSPCEQDGRCPLQKPVQTSTGGMGLVIYIGKHNDLGRTLTRFDESTCQQGIKDRLWFFRMGAEDSDLSETNGVERPMHSRLFCLTPLSKTTNILQLEIRPGSNSSRCSHTMLEYSKGYAFPPFCLIGRCLTKLRSEKIPWVLLITPLWKPQTWFPLLPEMCVELPVLLPSNIDLLTDLHGTLHLMILQGHVPTTSCSLQNRGLSEKAIILLCASWRSNTESSYSSSWRIWETWCTSEGINPLRATIENVLEFLTGQFV